MNIKRSDPFISVVLSFYNNLKKLDLTLIGYERQVYQNFELILCDDGSDSENSIQAQNLLLRCSFKNKYVYQEKKGFRLASSRNIGIRKSKGDRILFSDSDIIPNSNFIREHAKSHDKADILVGLIHQIDKNPLIIKDDHLFNQLTGIDSRIKNWKRKYMNLSSIEDPYYFV
ncbi:MAG: glycosyltransferase [Candidatus Helarchaeota archaeon]